KARFFSEERPAIGLIETLRYDPKQGFVRLPLHLARMNASAAALGIAFDETAARKSLDDAVNGASQILRVRLSLSEAGAVACSVKPLGADPSHWTYAVSDKTLRSADALSRYKIDWRDIYETEYARLHALTRCDEVLFLNEKGEAAEGSRTNVFARFGDALL